MNKAVRTLLLALFGVCMMAPYAFAEGAADNGYTMNGWIALGAGIGLGLAAFGGSLGQGRAAAAALEGIARNPGASDKIFTPLILGLALIESLVIYSMVVGFVLIGSMWTPAG